MLYDIHSDPDERNDPAAKAGGRWRPAPRALVVSDIDDTLVLEHRGDQPGLDELREQLLARPRTVVFGVATGRKVTTVRTIFTEHRLPDPEFVIASVGTRIHHGLDAEPDAEWSELLSTGWRPAEVEALAARVPGLRLQEPARQDRFKVSFYVEPAQFDEQALRTAMSELGSAVTIVVSRDRFVDVLPGHASKGAALSHVCRQLSMPLEACVACGDSGNDREMLSTAGRAVVVGNHSRELESLRGRPGIFFSSLPGAAGVLDGLRHHGLLG